MSLGYKVAVILSFGKHMSFAFCVCVFGDHHLEIYR